MHQGSVHTVRVWSASLRLVLLAVCLTQACTEPDAPRSPLFDLGVAVVRRETALATLPGNPPEPLVSARLRGRYVNVGNGDVMELFVGESGLAVRRAGVAAAPVRAEGEMLVVWMPRGDELEGEFLEQQGDGLLFRDALWRRDPGTRRPSPVVALNRVLGLYEPADHDGVPLRFYLLQWEGQLWVQINDLYMVSAESTAEAVKLADSRLGIERVAWAEAGNPGAGLELGGVTLGRTFGVGQGPVTRIDAFSSIEQLREEAMAASPPDEHREFRVPDLVELIKLEAGIRLEIRYATSSNFVGIVFYQQPRAFLQRPAAEALARVHRRLAEQGYGLLVYDAYRPWFVTKMFWDATPEPWKHFVADPANGSRHNRGCAVDLTLIDLVTGGPVEMMGGYDEFSERSYPFYPGGTDRQRWHRELLRRAMEGEGFAVYEYEWWHFDFHEWAEYPILDRSFDSLEDAE